MNFLNYTFKQKNDWTCGPAVARIFLHSRGKQIGLKEIIRALRTTREGTSNANLVRFIRRHSLYYIEKQKATLRDLKSQSKNKIVIVSYWIPRSKVHHYSIVKKVGKRRIYFHDTWYGSKHNYSVDYFLKNWRDEEAVRWMLAVKP